MKRNSFLKESQKKVKTQIQGETVRVTGKSRDELQAVMDFLRGMELDRPLQFENYR